MSDLQISSHLKETRRFEPPTEFALACAHRIEGRVTTGSTARASNHPRPSGKERRRRLVWQKPWNKLLTWELPHARWFEGATLNVTESCLDQHLKTDVRKKTAIIWEGELDEGKPSSIRRLTYEELHHEVVRCAGALAKLGVTKGDRVAIYMGMVPEVAVAMLACARLGATHSVVFGGFRGRRAPRSHQRLRSQGAHHPRRRDATRQLGALKITADKSGRAMPEHREGPRVSAPRAGEGAHPR